VLGLWCALVVANFSLLAFEIQIIAAPICGSYMDGIFQDTGVSLIIECLESTGLDPWSGDRGLYMLFTTILTGLLIDVSMRCACVCTGSPPCRVRTAHSTFYREGCVNIGGVLRAVQRAR
jgi:hypothetical protein